MTEGTRGSRARFELAWLVLLLAFLAALRLQRFAGDGPYGLDASFYFQIARHVAHGDGLLTSVSLYFEGWKLPARTIAYPLWPLLLGAVGRVFGLVQAANFLPPLLYIVSLPLFYFVARRVESEIGSDEALPPWSPRGAHLLLLLFALNPQYYASTTHPYTEGCAFVLALLALAVMRQTSVRAAAFAGLLCALAFLARSQMIAAAFGCAVALACESWRDRRFARLVAFIAAAAVPVCVWMVYAGYIPGVAVIDAATRRVDIPTFSQQVASAGVADYFVKRLPGIAIAFSPSSPFSYVRTFGAAAFLVPFGALVWLLRRTSGRNRDSRTGTTTVAALATGAFALVTLFLYRGDFFLPWLFAWRHGIPLIFLLMVVVPYLMSLGLRTLSAGTAVVVALSAATGLVAILQFVRSVESGYSPAERQLLTWLDSSPRTPTLLTTHAQTLAVRANANLHWTICTATSPMTKRVLDALPIDYVIVYEAETACPFAQELSDRLQGVAVFGRPGERIFVLGRKRGRT